MNDLRHDTLHYECIVTKKNLYESIVDFARIKLLIIHPTFYLSFILMMKKIYLPLMLLTVFILGWCSSTPKDTSVLDCNAKPEAERAQCVVDTIKWISNKFIRNCVENNILSNTGVSASISAANVSTGQVKDIDTLARECVSYTIANPWYTSMTTTPVFSPFMNSVAWSFVGSYLANSFFGMSRYNYNYAVPMSVQNNYYRDYRKDEERRRAGWTYTPVRMFAWSSRSISSVYSSAKSSTSVKWSLGGSAKSWSSTSSHSSSLS